MSKKIDLKNKTEKELATIVSENREKLRNFRFGIAGSKTKNVKEGKNLKKEISQVLTEVTLRQKQVK